MPKQSYRDNAAACLRLANEMPASRMRAALLQMAEAWMRLDEQAERNSRADLSYETPSRR
jgi:hypothetical protein